MKEVHYNGQTPSSDANSFAVNSHSPSGSTGSLDMSSSPFICAPIKHQSTPIASPVAAVSIVMTVIDANPLPPLTPVVNTATKKKKNDS